MSQRRGAVSSTLGPWSLDVFGLFRSRQRTLERKLRWSIARILIAATTHSSPYFQLLLECNFQSVILRLAKIRVPQETESVSVRGGVGGHHDAYDRCVVPAWCWSGYSSSMLGRRLKTH